jgi:zeaxanthin glucosyltransferase
LAQIGFLSLYAAGHMNPMTTLGRSLAARGHSVTFFCLPDLEDKVTHTGLHAVTFAHEEYPLESLKISSAKIGTLLGPDALSYFIERMLTFAEASFQHLPKLIKAKNLEMLVIDQLYPGGSTIAEHLNIPFISAANAAHVNREDSVPPPSIPWPYDSSEEGRARNRKGWAGVAQVFTPLLQRVNAQREAWQLPMHQDFLEDSLSPQLQITQQPRVFDFPREDAPANLHYVGPLMDEMTTAGIPFPWEWLDKDSSNGRPLVYATMGTLHNGLAEIFQAMIDACSGLNVQAIVSLGNGSVDASRFGKIPDNVLVVPFCPQAELMKRATLCVAHAGLNTALDCLSNGLPMVAIPIAADQPGVAMRLAYTGTGEVIPFSQLTAPSLRTTIEKVLGDPTYRINAQHISQEMRKLDSLIEACELIENALDSVAVFSSTR